MPGQFKGKRKRKNGLKCIWVAVAVTILFDFLVGCISDFLINKLYNLENCFYRLYLVKSVHVYAHSTCACMLYVHL